MDFHGLSRKELQALCKLNKIPANMTNVAMADALKSLQNVQGIDDILNPSESPATAANVPRTCTRRTSKPISDESQPMTKSSRRRAISDDMKEESKIAFPKTPRTTRNTTLPAAEGEVETYSRTKDGTTNFKEGSTVQRVYSTRLSTRLAHKSIPMGKQDKIDSLATELSKIDLALVSDNLGNDWSLVLQEPVNKSDAAASQVETKNKDDEFHVGKIDTYEFDDEAKSEEIAKALDGLNDVQEHSTNSSMIETDGEVDKRDFAAINSATENGNDEGLEYSVDTENPIEQLKSDVAAPETDMEMKEDVHEEIVEELKGKSEQLSDTLDESHLVHEVNVNSLVTGNEDNKVEGSSVDTEDLASEILNSNDLKDNAEIEMDSEMFFPNEVESSEGGDSQPLEHITCAKESDAEIFNSNDLKDNAEIEMDSEKSFPNKVESSEGGSQPLEHTTCTKESDAEILNNSDPTENAFRKDICSTDSKNSFSNEIEPSWVNHTAKDVVAASIFKDGPVIVVGSLDSSSHVASPIESTMKKTVTKTPSIKGLNCVSDDKENIDRSGMKFEPIKEEAKINKKEAEDLNAKSLRELTKMLKEKLQISNTTEEVAKLTKARPALQKLEANSQR